MNQAEVDQAVNSIADSIIDVADNDNPLESSVVRPTKEVEEPVEEAPEVPPETPPEPTPIEKKKIKWQGQDVEIEPDKEVEYLQKGYDYTQKTQELSKIKADLAPLEGLAKQINQDPNFAKYLAGYFQQKVESPKFDDPIEELKYNIKQETIEEVKKSLVAPLQEQNKQMTIQQAIQRTQAQVMQDPLYNQVQKAMTEYVQSLPPQLQRTTYMQLDQDPNAYIEAYVHFRKQIETKPKPPEPTPVKKEERAPILESAGKAQETAGNAPNKDKVAKLKAKALREGDPQAIADWLVQGGHINHLF